MLGDFWNKWSRLVQTSAASWPHADSVVFLDRRELPWGIHLSEAASLRELDRYAGDRAVDGWPAFMAAVQLIHFKEPEQTGFSNPFIDMAVEMVGEPRAQSAYRLLESTMEWRVRCSSAAAERCEGRVLVVDDLFGDLFLVAQEIAGRGKRCRFFVAEGRPFLEGSRIAAWTLKQRGFDTTVITDNAVGYVVWRRMVDMVLMEAVGVADSGEFMTSAGGYQTAVACAENKVKVVMIAYPFRVGQRVERHPEPRHVLIYRGRNITSPDLTTYYSLYDFVDASFVSEVITPFGIYSSAETALRELTRG